MLLLKVFAIIHVVIRTHLLALASKTEQKIGLFQYLRTTIIIIIIMSSDAPNDLHEETSQGVETSEKERCPFSIATGEGEEKRKRKEHRV